MPLGSQEKLALGRIMPARWRQWVLPVAAAEVGEARHVNAASQTYLEDALPAWIHDEYT
jgi:hypothetical protein